MSQSAFFFKVWSFLLAVGVICASTALSHAQRPRFADPFGNQAGNLGQAGNVGLPQSGLITSAIQNAPQLPALVQPGAPTANFNPGAFPQIQPPGNVGNIPTLDLPRSGQAFSNQIFPGRDPSQYQLQPFPIFPNPARLPSAAIQPPAGFPPANFPGGPPPAIGFQNVPPSGFNSVLPDARIGQPQYNYGSDGYGNRWPYQGTGSNWLPAIDWSWPRQQWQRFQTQFLPRVLERPRFRHTYLHGSNRNGINGNELDINDIEVATTLTVPNFLQSQQPLRISPGFIASFWDGPDTPSTGFDLPARAFGAYLGMDHVTDLAKTSGLESNFTVGVYSDYENYSSDAIRLTGRLLGWQRINEYTVGKLGVEYLDRIKVKLLPAVGLFMSPNADMKFDLYFPRTKLAHRIPNVGNYEMWAYAGGEYGGGSWAIERIDGSNDQVDINDVRAFIGVEWIGPRRVTGFFDFGYAFERELVYRSNPLNDLELQDTLMVRSGLAF